MVGYHLPEGKSSTRSCCIWCSRLSSRFAPASASVANSPAPGKGADNQQQDTGPSQRGQESPEPAIDIDAKEPQDQPAEQPANNADDDVAQNAQLIALNQPIRNRASNAPDNDPHNQSSDGAKNTCLPAHMFLARHTLCKVGERGCCEQAERASLVL